MAYPFTIINAESYYISHIQRIHQIYALIDLLASVRKTDVKQVRELKNIILDIEQKKIQKNLHIKMIEVTFEDGSYTVFWNRGRINIEIAEYARIYLMIFAPTIHKPFDHKDNCNFSTLALSKLLTLERENNIDIFYIYGRLYGDIIWIYLYLKFLIRYSFYQLNKSELFGLYHYIKSYLFTDSIVEHFELQRNFFNLKECRFYEKEFLRNIESKLPMDEVDRRIKLVKNKKSLFTRWSG